MQKTLGGDRLGAGKKMQVHLHNYERSTHDLSYLWRSTMAAGTLVPFMSELALPGDTFDVNLNCEIRTHPTIGPLFGSFKVQLDVFLAPIRLYNSLLHNNMLGIGMNMNRVKLPQMRLITSTLNAPPPPIEKLETSQVNPSSLLAYLGIRGIGDAAGNAIHREFNAIPLLAYWEIYKNYYSNKQEEIGAAINTSAEPLIETIEEIATVNTDNNNVAIAKQPLSEVITIANGAPIIITFIGTTPKPDQIIFETSLGNIIGTEFNPQTGLAGILVGQNNKGIMAIYSWRYRNETDLITGPPQVSTFPLSHIDEMRKAILSYNSETDPFIIDDAEEAPYVYTTGITNNTPNRLSSQQGIGLKTYQSDIFNNWLSTEWIDGPNGISEITAVSTEGNSFTIDSLNLAKKVYEMLNRIAVSGGSYNDWLDAVYTHPRYTLAESPMYMGGLSKELVFEEVVANTASADAPAGNLAGKGRLTGKHKGGSMVIKVDEPSYILGIISLTPRIDYSQGNKWDMHLKTMDDLHKPALDEIGFQELITEQMAWWDTKYNLTTFEWETRSAGKQPAWLNYMTNHNKTYGNFAIPDNEMFMTLNRRYEVDETTRQIKDLTTYIDPSKFNHIFAETARDAQNFWTQIDCNITARRKMSAKLMPNL